MKSARKQVDTVMKYIMFLLVFMSKPYKSLLFTILCPFKQKSILLSVMRLQTANKLTLCTLSKSNRDNILKKYNYSHIVQCVMMVHAEVRNSYITMKICCGCPVV